MRYLGAMFFPCDSSVTHPVSSATSPTLLRETCGSVFRNGRTRARNLFCIGLPRWPRISSEGSTNCTSSCCAVNSCDVDPTARRCGGHSKGDEGGLYNNLCLPQFASVRHKRTIPEVIKTWLAFTRTSEEKTKTTDDTSGDRTDDSHRHTG